MTRVRAADQMLVGAASDDARERALELQQLLWACDVRCEIFADEIPLELNGLVRPRSSMRDAPEAGLLFVHLSGAVAEPAAGVPIGGGLALWSGRKVLVMHPGSDADLSTLAPSFDLGIGVTEAERERLVSAGFVKTAVVPLPKSCEDARQVADALRTALALIDVELPAPARRNIVVLSSDRRCGLHDYSTGVSRGLTRLGHRVTFIGVQHADTADLMRKLGHIRADVDAVLVEHEAGVFRDVSLVRALLRLRRRGRAIVLSLHELEPGKFHHYRRLIDVANERPAGSLIVDALLLPWRMLRAAAWLARYRTITTLMGALPDRLVVHSPRSERWLSLLTRNDEKTDSFPHPVMAIEDTERIGPAEKRALRRRLGIPLDAFVFVTMGFFFRRKRYLEIIRALPSDAFLVISGTRSESAPEYYDEVVAEARRRRNVLVNDDYELYGDHIVAADCAVLFYEEIFQSGALAQAVWAGLPAIVSDVEGFRPLGAASIVVKDTGELARAMDEVRRAETYERLQRGAETLRRLFAPERLANRYFAGLGR